MKITIGTRGSALALTQTEYVKSQLEKAYPMHTYEIKIIRTKGDNIRLNAWFDIWLNTHKKRSIKESTMVRYDDFYHRYMAEQIGKNKTSGFYPYFD